MESWGSSGKALGNLSKWEGEDEENIVKDSWDQDSDVEEEKKEDAPKPATVKKNLKKICKRFEEKEKKRLEEFEAKKKALMDKRNKTPEEILADKLRRQKLQEEADLSLAKEICGVAPKDPSNPLLKEKVTSDLTS